jgi:uncharacterized lipoprotein YddW (UPF0748 family)
MAKRILGYIVAVCLLATYMVPINASNQPKREFRGAWIQCVNGQFQGLSTIDMQQTLRSQLDVLQKDGINTIIFQVRPEADALYNSPYEPWSRFLTGVQGKAPSPYWDPLKWMIEECHKRGMELHAWINPYRAKTKTTTALAPNHIGNTHPELLFSYDDQLIFNPGIPQNRTYICKIVDDIVRRYDVDGIHIDDYFYPYPVVGLQIPDDAQYSLYSNGIKDRGDWRRYNVNLLIKQLYDSIRSVKPWVKFGVSPFGIFRNKTADPLNGSDTRGLQNYDDLYADVLLWVNNGWIDYCVPQIYWEIGHPTADYATLIKWWNKNASKRVLVIGQDVERTVKKPDLSDPMINQQPAKMLLQRSLSNVKGSCQWYAKAVVDNVGNYGSMLSGIYHRYPALQPSMPYITDKTPNKVKKLKPVWTSDGYILFWTTPKSKSWKDEAVKYVVYKFNSDERVDTSDPSKIVAITSDTFYKLPYENGKTKFVYVITALNKIQNESKMVKKKIKL